MKVRLGRMNQKNKKKTRECVVERDAFRKERKSNCVKCC